MRISINIFEYGKLIESRILYNQENIFRLFDVISEEKYKLVEALGIEPTVVKDEYNYLYYILCDKYKYVIDYSEIMSQII